MSHYMKRDQVVGWGPTVEEINHLSLLFDEVHHLGCLHPGSVPGSSLPYENKNITFIPLPPAGGNQLKDKFAILKFTPLYLSAIWKALDGADVVHLRCPANIPLLALLVLIIRKKPPMRWVKYAGDWGAGVDYPFFYRLQRWILQKNLARCIVTVNGQWENQKPFVVTFNNPCLTSDEVQSAADTVDKKEISSPVRLIFVGALNERKGVSRLLETALLLKEGGVPFILDILGDGEERSVYEEWCRMKGIAPLINFHGWIPRSGLKTFYERAHLNLLPSESEGWPKVLSEGMAYGVVPIAGAVSSIPQMLEKTGAGIPINPFDVEGFARAVRDMVHQPGLWKAYSRKAVEAAPLFTYDHYLSSVKALFKSAWDVEL